MALDMGFEQTGGGDGTTVITLTGELDASNFTELIEAGRRLHADGTRRIVLDLAGLSFLASSGLVALHSLIRILRGEAPPDPEEGWGAIHSLEFDVSGGGAQDEVVLVAPQAAVDRVLERTGLKRLFRVHADRSAALADA
jgi:anti-anti-sigma regulatory factor